MCKRSHFTVVLLCSHLRLLRQFKADLFIILDKFAEKAVQLHDLYVQCRSTSSATHLQVGTMGGRLSCWIFPRRLSM